LTNHSDIKLGLLRDLCESELMGIYMDLYLREILSTWKFRYHFFLPPCSNRSSNSFVFSPFAVMFCSDLSRWKTYLTALVVQTTNEYSSCLILIGWIAF